MRSSKIFAGVRRRRRGADHGPAAVLQLEALGGVAFQVPESAGEVHADLGAGSAPADTDDRPRPENFQGDQRAGRSADRSD